MSAPPGPLLGGVRWQGRIFSGGWVPGSGGEYDSVEPATGQVLARVGAASAADLPQAAETAHRAQQEWAALPYDQRARVLRRAARLFEDHADEIDEWLVRESGATRPFNAPIILSIRAIAPALVLGNAVLMKPDPRTAVCGGVVLARVFEEAGLPEGLFHLLPGGVDVGGALVEDPLVRVIAFTGSTRAGRQIAAAAGERLKRVHLELGGNSALVVLDDVDVEQAVSVGSFGSFNHSGQICMATSRHLVAEKIAADYAAALAEHAARLPVGDPARADVAVGPIIDAGQRDRIHEIVTSSVDAGAKLAAGGTFEGLFYSPTVLTDVPLTAPAYAQEIFGPVAPVVPFSTVDEAVRLAGGTGYGLSLGILTRDVSKGLALAERIPSGLVHINDQTVNDEALAPFGGVGESGTGSRHGGARANLEAFTETQWVTVRGDLPRYPF
ncbi:aldehyde dehydrogenase family protein [Amycolatopsis sp. NPDC051373]|uniref:aldehyde dehydrogenase family protein n=1 Tax=Amycolatopsis sp. NPDC051373 TaxID=3155801 RepID=UPI00344D9706